MDFNYLIEGALNEEDISEIEVEIVDLPLVGMAERLKDARDLWGQSVKKIDEKKFVKRDRSEGFFFHYNPTAKKYFESNSSFQFMFFKPPAGAGYPPPPVVNEYWNHFVFEVDHKEKKVFFEKQSQSNKLRTYYIESRDIQRYKNAISKAVSRHPEIEQYKIPEIKEVTSVQEFMNFNDTESIGKNKKMKIFIATNGYVAINALKEGFNIESEHGIELTLQGAKKISKQFEDTDISRTWAILSAEVSGTSIKLTNIDDIKLIDSIPASNLKLEKISDKEYAEKKFTREKVETSLSKEVLDKISIGEIYLLDPEELSRVSRSSKGNTGSYSSWGEENVYYVRTRRYGDTLIADKTKVDKKRIEEVLASILLASTRYIYLDHGREIKQLYKDPKKSYKLVFEGKAPKGLLFTREIIESIFSYQDEEAAVCTNIAKLLIKANSRGLK